MGLVCWRCSLSSPCFNFIWLTSLEDDLKNFPLVVPAAQEVREIRVASYSGPHSESNVFKINEVDFNIQPFFLSNEPYTLRFHTFDDEDLNDRSNSAPFRVANLPNCLLDGLFESLIFDDDISERMLRFTTNMTKMMQKTDLNPFIINWNHLILLHGPPGSGKTSLARAIAQKLAIRLTQHFSKFKLVEVNAQALFSRYFGESAGLVEKAFQAVIDLAQQADRGAENSLVCVVIDEVESLAGSREKAVEGNEVADALRVTNELLIALDKIRHIHNIVVFCTTNLQSALVRSVEVDSARSRFNVHQLTFLQDSAFLDRVDIIERIPNPSSAASYEILRSCLNELLRCGIIQRTLNIVIVEDEEEGDVFPPLAAVRCSVDACSSAKHLLSIAERCAGLSGRALRRLPYLGLALYGYGDTYSISDALSLLDAAVQKEKRENFEAGAVLA
jgi:pachytene checkpoint protein 2